MKKKFYTNKFHVQYANKHLLLYNYYDYIIESSNYIIDHRKQCYMQRVKRRGEFQPLLQGTTITTKQSYMRFFALITIKQVFVFESDIISFILSKKLCFESLAFSSLAVLPVQVLLANGDFLTDNPLEILCTSAILKL